MISRLPFRLIGSGLRFYGRAAPESGEKWNIVTAVCLQRKPVITKPMSKEERATADLMLQIEKENSLKNSWEVEAEEEKRAIQDEGKIVLKTYADWEVQWKSELEKMKLGSRLTEADSKKDVKSLDRLLDSTLMLVVKQKNQGIRWILPQSQHQGSESLRETAERVLRRHLGNGFKVRFYGNAPCGFFKYKYPTAARDKLKCVGDKVFFYKAFYIGGQVSLGSEVEDYKWIGRNEVKEELESAYCRAVEMFLLDEDNLS